MQAQFNRAENNIRELTLSVNLMKKESKKLLERSVLAENDMKRGYSDLRCNIISNMLMGTWINFSHSVQLMHKMVCRGAGNQIQSLARSVYKAEATADGNIHNHLPTLLFFLLSNLNVIDPKCN